MKRIGVVVFSLILGLPCLLFAQSDLFEIRTPNALIIFDTSSSMNKKPDGLDAPPGEVCVRSNDGLVQSTNGGLPPCEEGFSKYRFEGWTSSNPSLGGNHPFSKLYTAKQALGNVIKGLENVNLGLATYGQLKSDAVRGYYYRNRKKYTAPTPDRWEWRKLYWRFNKYKHGAWSSVSFSKDSFTDKWNNLRTGVSVGSTFTIVHTFDNSPGNNGKDVPPPHPPGQYSGLLTIKVTKVDYSPEYNNYTFWYTDDPHDHYEEAVQTKAFPDSNPIDCDAYFPKNWPTGGYKTYNSSDAEQISNPSKWECKGPFLVKGTAGGFGDWFREYSWLDSPGTICPAVAGTAQNPAENPGQDSYTQWFLADPNDTSLPSQFVKSLKMNCYDNSSFAYPADGSTNKPHTWSYFRIYGGIWPVNDPARPQPSPYYPAPNGEPGAHDNHFFFINFPEVDDALNNYQTREKITTLLDVSPVQSPESGNYHTKLPLKAGSITSNTVESSYTPLADSLALARRYFMDYIFTYQGGDAATQANCRGNYIILLTDGLESARFKDGKPDYDAAAEEAKALYELVKDKQGRPCGVKTYVIGFGKGLGDNPAVLNSIAEKGGTVKAYFTENLRDLTTAFQEIFEAIKDNYSRSNPVVARDRKSIYKGYLSFPGWNGHLVKYEADKIDEAKNVFKYEDRTWDAGQLMNNEGRGAIYTWTEKKFEPSEVDFVTLNAGMLKSELNADPEIDINNDGKKDSDDAKTIISFVLDPGFDGGKYKGTRSGNWKLGDIYHSTPLVVGPPSMNIPDNLFPKKYSKFREDQKNRPTLVYVGANDGMLHAFGEDGKERFAVIPKNLLGKLRDLRTDHQFFVDSSPRAYDVYFSKGKDEWKTVVISGLRGGGNYYFALDVTNPSSPNVLWEQTDSRMGYTWSRPEIGRVRLGGQEKFVAFVGGGYSDPNDSKFDNIGNTFYVIDIEETDSSKRILKRFEVGGKSNKVPGGAMAFDRDFDGRIDAVYFGDIQGALWKIKIDGQEDVKNWQLVKLFQSDGGLPIFYPPVVTKNNQGKVLVYFGQGDELNLFEKTSANSFYEIWDKGTEGEKVWRKQLRPGEKVLSAPLIDNNTVYFTTWEYTGIEGECGKGMGRLYGLTTTREGKTGGLAGLTILNTETNLWKPPVESLGLGRGIPTAPIIVVRGKRQWIAYSSSVRSDEVRLIGPIPGGGRARLKSWREVF